MAKFHGTPPVGDFEELCLLPNGHMLYRVPNVAGGHDYWSDEVGGGVLVWCTSLVDEGTLLTAMAEEKRRAYEEQREKRDGASDKTTTITNRATATTETITNGEPF